MQDTENWYDDIYISVIRRNKHSGQYDEIHMRKLKTLSISHSIWNCFNYIDGDSYGWPDDNTTPEEIDEQYKDGQRFFIFEDFYTDASVSILPSTADIVKYNKIENQELIKELTSMIDDLVDIIDPNPDDPNAPTRHPIVDSAIDLVMKANYPDKVVNS